MNNNTTTPANRKLDPFDSSAQARLINIGVLNGDGTVNVHNMPVYASIFTGLFFDDLFDRYDDVSHINFVFSLFEEFYGRGDYQQMYLFLSMQYDSIRKQLPDPVWLLAGNKAAVRAFMPLFMTRLKSLMTESGLLAPADGR